MVSYAVYGVKVANATELTEAIKFLDASTEDCFDFVLYVPGADLLVTKVSSGVYVVDEPPESFSFKWDARSLTGVLVGPCELFLKFEFVNSAPGLCYRLVY